MMSQVAKARSSREIALARRKALSSSGKAALKGGDKRGQVNSGVVPDAGASEGMVAAPQPRRGAPAELSGGARAVSLARRKALSTRGKAADMSRDRTRGAGDERNVRSASKKSGLVASTSSDSLKKEGCHCGCKSKSSALPGSGSAVRRSPVRNRSASTSNSGRALALARRNALSSRGKAALSGKVSEAQAIRASNPKMSSRELAQVVREQRSRRGNAGQKKSAPCGRRRKAKSQSETPEGARDASWKVGASETAIGQVVTGTMVGRKASMTGDEQSICRTITGTEYLGAEIFREFCQTEAVPETAPRKVAVTSTSHGNAVSGDRLGRAPNVTGNEPGTCKRVTGDEYVSAEQVQSYCGELAPKSPPKVSMAETMKGKVVTGVNVGRSEAVTGDEYGMRQSLTGTQYTKPAEIGRAPSKVGVSTTLRGETVTGTQVGRREQMTGDEAGSCRNVTGDDYVGKEQYSEICNSTPPQPRDRKVNESTTLGGRNVTGSLADRSERVTGNEPGTCKAVTGTPYSGGEQYSHYCSPEQQREAIARMRPMASVWGKSMTGQQPGVRGVMTGADKGACEPVSGTPYVGADQIADTCPSMAAETASPDFPQSLDKALWGDFTPESPAHAAHSKVGPQNVTGSHYESGAITGPFGMADGKVTGTEEARFDRPQVEPVESIVTAETIHGRVKSRVTGEGIDAGSRITGDDWDRGDRVTGTEGPSARRRNPTLRQPTTVPMPAASMTRPEGVPEPVSMVTGGSGNTDKGSLVTYSGGARG